MQSIERFAGVTGVVLALVVAACGGSPTTTGAPQGTGAAGTPAAVTAAPAGGNVEARLRALGPELLTPIFGASIPTPTCTAMGDGGGVQCRWSADDGALLLDADADPTFESEDAWREAFGTAGFDEEIPGIGVAALGGDNPLSDGWRATAFASNGVAYTVTINKSGDVAAVKALVSAVLKALAG